MISFTLFGASFASPFFILLALVLIFLLGYKSKKNLSKRFATIIFILRSLAIISICLVLAMPYGIVEETVQSKQSSIIIVDDYSASMSLHEEGMGARVRNMIGKRTSDIAELSYVNLSEKDSSAIGDAIYREILNSGRRSNIVVLASDGNNNRGKSLLDVSSFARDARSRVFTILPKSMAKDSYIKTIDAARKIAVNSEYEGKVVVSSLGSESSYDLSVTIDGESVLDTPVIQNKEELEFSFSKVMNNMGSHDVIAKIDPKSADRITENNVFRTVVEVVERPKVLLVTKDGESPLKQVLSEIYELEVVGELPNELDGYSAIILDDLDIAEIGDVSRIKGFLNEGSGVLVVGGEDSYEFGDYYGNEIEDILPVRSSEEEGKESKQINVVIVLDISGSTGSDLSGNTKIDVEKAIAVDIIRDLYEDARIGIGAFNSNFFLLSPIRKLSDRRVLEDKIERLRFGGGTYVSIGLEGAREMLGQSQGSKYVVLISDGVTDYPVRAYDEADELALEGVTIHSVGVGFDTDQAFMVGLARRGGGLYFAPKDSERIKIITGELEEDEDDDAGLFLKIIDPYHFITEGLGYANVSIKDYNRVSKKSSSQILGTTGGLTPLLTVSRYGLGRVVSLTVDNGLLWAPSLYSSDNSRIISSSLNWLIGDPEKNKDFGIECSDVSLGERSSINVKSKESYPQVFSNEIRADLKRLDENSYYFSESYEQEGFFEIRGEGDSCTVAVNYPEEYGELSVDVPTLETVARLGGGESYGSDRIPELVERITSETIEEANGTVIEQRNLQFYFSTIALLLFFLDVCLRRIMEIKGKYEKKDKSEKWREKREESKEKGLSPKQNKISHVFAPKKHKIPSQPK